MFPWNALALSVNIRKDIQPYTQESCGLGDRSCFSHWVLQTITPSQLGGFLTEEYKEYCSALLNSITELLNWNHSNSLMIIHVSNYAPVESSTSSLGCRARKGRWREWKRRRWNLCVLFMVVQLHIFFVNITLELLMAIGCVCTFCVSFIRILEIE